MASAKAFVFPCSSFMIRFLIVLLLTSSSYLAFSLESHCSPEATEYSHECATEAVRYASIAYMPDTDSLKTWSCQSCMLVPELEVLKIFQGPKKENFGYVGVQKSYPYNVILAFRGTSFTDEKTAIADLEFTERRWPSYVDQSAVDHGFLEYFLSVENDVRNTLEDYLERTPDAPLFITGHSLGGAVSLIAAVALNNLIPDPLIYTFGGPRVGNFYFAQYLQSVLPSRIYRVVHDHDIVAHLPPCSWIPWSSYCEGPKFPSHVPTEVLYDASMSQNYTVCDHENGEDPECSDRFSPVSLSVDQHLYYFGFRVGFPATVVTVPDYESLI